MSGQTLLDFQDKDHAIVHATCVAVGGCGALIVGRSGVGKSGLALQMIAAGAILVADDRVELRMVDGQVLADAPESIRGLIEARGIGLVRAQPAGATEVTYVVDLDQTEQARLPDPVTIQLLRQTVPLLRAAAIPNLPAALLQLLKMGRVDPDWLGT
ncbi:HPr kinase/phosphorylase [Ruegeria meonggei]|uniref:HPr kinase/phosphorylase n=1 Tax=Ruegeria meonggei TaxID=1446476 RepID=A0A1X7AAT2_9RHOB|nr:serine kinase [Ruegeria meonggei]SLN74536.1 HPr kinase/phosphorylase [Ruegeria meonggei]